MTRRFAPWLATAALMLQAALPAAGAHAAGAPVADGLVICTAAGLVTIPGGALPAGPAGRAGMATSGACHALCPDGGARRRQGRRAPLTPR